MIEFGPKPEGLKIEAKEQERVNDVARVFLVTTRTSRELTPDYIEDLGGLSQVFLTTGLWLEKGEGSVNEGQVMPVGGNRKLRKNGEPAESLRATASRESREEARLNVEESSLKELGDVKYVIDHPTKGRLKIKSHYYLGRISPHDEARQLYEDEDKIRNFLRLDALGHATLMGGVRVDQRTEDEFKGWVRDPRLLDSLQSPSLPSRPNLLPTKNKVAQAVFVNPGEDKTLTTEEKKKAEIEYDESVRTLQMNLMVEMQKIEADTKLAILRAFLRNYPPESEELEYQKFAQLLNNNDEEVLTPGIVVGDLWPGMIRYLEKRYSKSVIRKKFYEELDKQNLNFDVEAAESPAEIVIRSVYTLLESHNFSGEYFTSSRPEMKKFVESIMRFIDDVIKKYGLTKPKRLGLAEKMGYVKDLLEDVAGEPRKCEKVEQMFARDLDLPERQLVEFRNSVNNFLVIMANKIIERYQRLHKGKAVAVDPDPLNDIKDGALVDVINVALPDSSKGVRRDWKVREKVGEEEDAKNNLRRKVFEARRLIALMYSLNRSFDFYNRTILNGRAPVERIFTSLTSGAEQRRKRIKIAQGKKGGYIENVEILSSDKQREENSSPVVLRQARGVLAELSPGLKMEVDSHVKTLPSFYRKILQFRFDDDPSTKVQDIYRRALTLENSSLKRVVISERMGKYIADGKFTMVEPRSKLQKTVSADEPDYEDALNIAEAILIEGNQHPGQQVRVIDYRPCAAEGAGYESPFGSGRIRFSKFTIEHTDEKGNKRYEEVQIYFPTSDGKSAFYWKELKKRDDEFFFFDRILKSPYAHSLADLLFPPQIYGELVHLVHYKDKQQELEDLMSLKIG